MSPYKWGPSNYLCPDCKRRLEAKAGPDGLKAERCPNCDWWKVFDPNADEYPAQELERARLATDGGRSEGETYRLAQTSRPPKGMTGKGNTDGGEALGSTGPQEVVL